MRLPGRAGRPVALPPAYLDRARTVVDQRLLQAGRPAGRAPQRDARRPGTAVRRQRLPAGR